MLPSALYLLNWETLAVLPGQVGIWQVEEGGLCICLVLCRALSLMSQHWSCFSYRSLPPFPSVS